MIHQPQRVRFNPIVTTTLSTQNNLLPPPYHPATKNRWESFGVPSSSVQKVVVTIGIGATPPEQPLLYPHPLLPDIRRSTSLFSRRKGGCNTCSKSETERAFAGNSSVITTQLEGNEHAVRTYPGFYACCCDKVERKNWERKNQRSSGFVRHQLTLLKKLFGRRLSVEIMEEEDGKNNRPRVEEVDDGGGGGVVGGGTLSPCWTTLVDEGGKEEAEFSEGISQFTSTPMRKDYRHTVCEGTAASKMLLDPNLTYDVVDEIEAAEGTVHCRRQRQRKSSWTVSDFGSESFHSLPPTPSSLSASEETTDELSVNVDEILEDIANMEDILARSGNCVEVTASTTEDRRDDKFQGLVNTNECGAVSSSFSREKPPIPSKFRSTVLRSQFFRSHSFKTEFPSRRMQPLKAERKIMHQFDSKLSELKKDLHRSREEISKFHPNVEEIDNSVRSSIDRFGRNPNRSGWESPTSSLYSGKSTSNHRSLKGDEDKHTQQWNLILNDAKNKFALRSHSFNDGKFSRPKCGGILETDLDLDTGISRELNDIDSSCQFKDFDCSGESTVVKSSSGSYSSKVQSMQNLKFESKTALLSATSTSKEDRSRSMEFLDEEKKANLMPPENALKKNKETRQLSEHELSVQRSLQRLNVPDWYKSYATPGCSGVKLSNREFGSGTGLAGGWSGVSSKTSSLTSLSSPGRYAGSKTQFSSTKYKGTTSAGGRSSSSLMSPSSTASASPSPYYDRSSFTYGMSYALTRFATSRMSCGVSPASLSPSPSPVGGITSSTSTPVTSGPMSRCGYNKTPYLGWRSTERLNSNSAYRSPSERLAADLLQSQKQKSTTVPSTSTTGSEISIVTSPRKENSSDLSLNISDTSENKLNRVRSSIKEVSNAIVDYVNESKPLDEGMNGRASPRRGLIWLESSFVGSKPIDSPGTPDNPSVIMSKHLGAQSTAYLQTKHSSNKLDNHNGDNGKKDKDKTDSQAFPSYHTRNEKTGEGSNSSLSSVTMDDIIDSLLDLRRPKKKIRGKGNHKHTPKPTESSTTEPSQAPIIPLPLTTHPTSYEIPISDWQQRMNNPLDDTMYFPRENAPQSLVPNTSTTPRSNDNVETDTEGRKQGVVVGDAKSATKYGATTIGWDEPPPKDKDVEDEVVGLAQTEYGFDTATGIPATATTVAAPTLINNPLAGLTENISPVKHRRVSFDLDISDKEEKSSSRSKRDESIGGSIYCKNSKCGKSATNLEARRDFKTCHNCNAFYCSRECRRLSWEKHKRVCMQSRVGQLCKAIITHVKEDSFVVSQLSTVAKRGYMAKGRGCVKLFFSSPDRAERFLSGGLPELPEPWYIPQSDMLPEEMGTITFSELSDSCRGYNPETRFVIYVSVCVVNEVPTSGAVKWEREMISRSAKVRLLIPRSYDESQPHHHAAIPAHLNPDDINPRSFSPTGNHSTVNSIAISGGGESETLILSSVPTPASIKLNSREDRRRREISFTNIQKHLIERGIDLRRLYPEIYSKLCNYVENDEPFLPVTIYPTNSQTGNQFMCVIMPESSDTTYASSPGPYRKVIDIAE